MRSDQLRRLGIALVVLLVIWGGVSLLRGLRKDRPVGFVVSHLKPEEVDTILVSRGDTTIRLTRSGSSWRVNGYPTAENSVKEILDALADTSATSELVARSASSHARLGVDVVTGKRLVVKSGARELVRYVVGKRGSDWESGYVRRPGSDDVYLLKSRLADLTERRVDDWRDKRLAAVEADSVAELEVTRGRTGYLLERAGKLWKFKDGKETDSAAVAGLLGQFRNLSAAGFATRAQADSADFTRPERRVRLLAPGGRPLLALAIDSAGSNYWVRKDADSTVYRLDSWTADQLTPKDSTLRKKAPAKPAKSP
jgi:hypothetical protein